MKTFGRLDKVIIAVSVFVFIFVFKLHAAIVYHGPYLGPMTDTSVWVSWITDSPVSTAKVEYGLTSSYGNEVTSYTETAIYDGLYRHDIQITGLTAATEYHYRVTSDGEVSADYSFKTFVPSDSTSVKFVIVGDIQMETRELLFANTKLMQAIADNETDINAVIRLGDLVMDGSLPSEWERFFESSKVINKKFWQPTIVGNHEVQNIAGGFPSLYKQSFKFLTNINNHDNDGYYYSFDIGKVHFIAYCNVGDVKYPSGEYASRWLPENDSTRYNYRYTPSQTAIADWMKADADAAKAAGQNWVVVLNHLPVYSSGGWGNHATTELQWLTQSSYRNLIEEGVEADMHFSGHSHDYIRFGLTKEAALDPDAKTHYYVSGGATYGLRDLTLVDGDVQTWTYTRNPDGSYDAQTPTDHVPSALINGVTQNYEAAAGSNYNRYAANHYIVVEINGNECKTTMKFLRYTGVSPWLETTPEVYDEYTWTKTLSASTGSTQPTIAITTINNQSVTNQVFNISGTATPTGTRTIANVTCPNQTVAGTTSWSTDVILVEGVNSFPITVTDSEGETDTETITVNYEPARTYPIAFPGAEGYGKNSKGGRGGTVYHVTNLNDSGSGSLRAACEASGPRYVVFDVAGVIELQSPINISDPYITIAGETAPEGGITLYGVNGPGGIWTQWMPGDDPAVQVHDIIMRFIRIRGANNGNQGDALRLYNVTDAIIDHCSFSWASDETADLSRSRDITLQWSIFSDSINSGDDYNFGIFHCYGQSGRMSLHHNLISNHNFRYPVYNSDDIDIRNNIMYNWRDGATGLDNLTPLEHSIPLPHDVNIVGNYYKKGPNSRPARDDNEPIDISSSYRYYISGNYYYSTDGFETTVQNQMTHQGVTSWNDLGQELVGTPAITTHTVSDAYQLVLGGAGSLPYDTVDINSVNNTKNGTGSWVSAAAIDPSLLDNVFTGASALADTDNDGMSDAWEDANGLDKSVQDHNGDIDNDGYTNIEEYFHYRASVLMSELEAKLQTIINNNNTSTIPGTPEVLPIER